MWNGKGYTPGEHTVECQRCGLQYLSNEVRKEWTGLIVCEECFETRHPQEFVRAPKEDQSPKGIVSPEPADSFANTTYGDNGDPGIPDGTFDNGLD